MAASTEFYIKKAEKLLRRKKNTKQMLINHVSFYFSFLFFLFLSFLSNFSSFFSSFSFFSLLSHPPPTDYCSPALNSELLCGKLGRSPQHCVQYLYDVMVMATHIVNTKISLHYLNELLIVFT